MAKSGMPVAPRAAEFSASGQRRGRRRYKINASLSVPSQALPHYQNQSRPSRRTQSPLHFTAPPQHLTHPQQVKITSKSPHANVVGYTQTEAVYGYKAMGAAFVPVTEGEYSIQQIKPVPAEEGAEIEDWTYFIYEIGPGGSADGKTYVYMAAANGDVSEDGWYDADDTSELVPTTFKAGEAFAFDVDIEGCAIQTSGQVDLGEIVTPAVYGYKAMCNPYPVQISIQDMTPVPPEGTDTIEDWTYFIYEIGAGGSADGKTYVYMSAANGDVSEDGWYDADDTSELVEVPYEAGEGFAFDVDEEGCGLAFTCPVTIEK